MATEAEPQREIAKRLMSALQQDEFVLFSQRIVALVSRPDDWVFQEIFVRFKEEDAKLLPPGSFFPVLEECRMLSYLDRWVVNRLARWVRSGLKILPDWPIPRSNVNLSDETLSDPKFASYVLQYVDGSFLSGGLLGFEVSCESVAAHRTGFAQLVSVLRPHGCGFTLSGIDGSERVMELLRAFKPDFVKIDARSVDPATVSETNRLCHAMGAKSIAENVENSRVLEHLRRCKIDFAQGFEIAPVEPL